MIFFDITHILSYKHFAVRVLGDVLTDLLTVCCVDSCGDGSWKQSSKKGNCPFRRIETNDVHRSELIELMCNHTGSKLFALDEILPKCESMPFPFSFHWEGSSVSINFIGSSELINQSGWLQGSHSLSRFSNGELHREVICPRDMSIRILWVSRSLQHCF